MNSQPQAIQAALDLDGAHPGPLFGPLRIRRAPQAAVRNRIYRRKLKRATPPWADLAEIRKLYREAKTLSLTTGVKHSVDHVIPLCGETVCGLHVHTNLRVCLHAENMRKGSFFVEQESLF